MTRRFFIAIMLLLVIAGTATYFFIPSPLIASHTVPFKTSLRGSYAVLTRQDLWDKFSAGNFSITKKLVNTIELTEKNKQLEQPVTILLVPQSEDSIFVTWTTTFPVVNNPVSKIRQYSRALNFKETFNDALMHFQSFAQQPENVYGIPIREMSTQDTFLIATRFSSLSVPSSELVYSYVKKLQTFAAASGARQAGPPMLNMSTADSIKFGNMVAIPISNIIRGSDSISFIRMVPGHFLTAEIKGGPQTVRNAHKIMNAYFEDFKRVSMAIPFEYLVTDRLSEADTSKWITKIYHPVY